MAEETVNHFEHIHSIIDAVFGPDDDSLVPATALDLTICAGCGGDMPPGATFHLCDHCHWIAIEEAV